MRLFKRISNSDGFGHIVVLLLVVVGVGAIGSYTIMSHAATPPANTTSSAPVTLVDAAPTPPMGFNDWYADRCTVTQADILAQANALVSSGLSKLGYNYVVIDDCWMASTRTASGALQANPTTFPNGMAWLASQIHAMGLKFGLYESAGTKTCGKYPGSYGHYTQDAQTFASWGVDFVKFDYCYLPSGSNPTSLFEQMSSALQASGRTIVYSQELPVQASTDPTAALFKQLVSASSQTANMWRVAPDFSTTEADGPQLMQHLNNDLPLYSYAGPGHWNDLDMILEGDASYGKILSQQTSEMSIWAELASPLFISTDITNMSATTLAALSNQSDIAVDQSGVQGKLAKAYGPDDVIVKPYPGGGYAVLLVNTSSASSTFTIPVSITGETATSSTFTNLWSGSVTNTTTSFTQTLGAYGTALYRVQ